MDPAAAKQQTRLQTALREASFAGLIAGLLSFPILALRVESDMNNRLVLEERWPFMGVAVIAIFVARFIASMLDDWRARGLAILGAWAILFSLALLVFPDRPQPILIGAFAAVGAALLTLALYFNTQKVDAPQSVSLRTRPLEPPSRGVSTANLFGMIALGVVIAYPLVLFFWLGPQGSLKWINNYGVQILIYVMLGWGLNIVVGLAGLLDLGYVAFYAVGAYAYALLATTFGLSFWICLPLAGILAAFWGILLGFPVLRLRGDYLALVTLAFGEIITIVLTNWVDLTNGEAGISSIPRVTFFGIPFTAADDGFAATFGIAFSPIHRTIFLFYLILVLALITNVITIRLRRLPIGRAWEALREDEIACRSLGVNTTKTKLTAFALGAMFGGLAGSFFAVRQGFINPNSFTFMESATILAIVVLGGMGSQLGRSPPS